MGDSNKPVPLAVTLRPHEDAPDAGQLLHHLLQDPSLELVDARRARVVVLGPLARDGVLPELEAARPVVVVTDHVGRERVGELLSAGASGVVALKQATASLVPALHAVASGLLVVPGESRDAAVRPALSLREKQVLGLVVMGLTNAEIGQRLFLAESTIKYHLLSIYGKLGVRTRREAAELAMDPASGISLGVVDMSGRSRSPGGYRKPHVN